MKKIYFIFLILISIKHVNAQQLYCDFENTDFLSFTYVDGYFDSLALNSLTNSTNTSSHCGMYVRDTNLYDVIVSKLEYHCLDISPYLSNNFNAPKITLKLFSTAPVGTYLLLQLGVLSNSQYPQGIHSEFFAITGSQNTWENLSFSYLQSTPNTTINYTDIDKMVLLIAPGTNQTDTFYIDDIYGPQLINTLSNHTSAATEIKHLNILQCSPNPAKDNTLIHFTVPFPSSVEIELLDIAGKKIYATQEYYPKEGVYIQQLELKNLPGGIYFVRIHSKNQTDIMKLILDR